MKAGGVCPFSLVGAGAGMLSFLDGGAMDAFNLVVVSGIERRGVYTADAGGLRQHIEFAAAAT